MIGERTGTPTRAELEAVLDNLRQEDTSAVNLAARLFDAGSISLVDTTSCTKPRDIVGYHVADDDQTNVILNEAALSNVCPVVNGAHAKRNGVVVKKGHDDLRCSCPACFYKVCPLGLAACFQGLDNLGSSIIPLYSEAIDVSQAISRFRRTWADRLIDSERAVNLLLSRTENDFSGVLIVEDPSFLDSFVNDLLGTLVKMGKIDEDGLERIHISSLLRSVNTVDATFHSTQDENLKARRLYVCDRLQDFFDRDTEHDFASKYLIERFGHIVDHRYLLLVGTHEEIARFIGMSPTLELLLGANHIELAGLSANDLFLLYQGQLEERLATQIDKNYRSYFVRYVDFNRDILPFHGPELSDYLAKHSNAKGSLSLPPSRYLSTSLDEMLDQIVGLEQVKHTIRELETYALFSKQARGRGKTMPSSSMHMVFMGNPGTGKTTVARIIATMLYKIGIISQNKCIEVTSKDLIARYVGHTDKQVYDVVQKARGGVLFIDEAYALAPDDHSTASFGREALAELVKLMEDYRDDLIVILAGYEREMADFLEVNTGLMSRIGYTFHFQDFTTDQLVQIFNNEMAKAGFTAEEGVEAELHQLFDYFRNFKSFGNGRFAREVLQKAIIAHATRLSKGELPTAEQSFMLTVEDIPTRREMLDTLDTDERAAADMLEPLVGLEDVKKKVLQLERVVTYRENARKQGMTLPQLNLHMLFTGNPGTGKTTIARIIGKVLFNIGAVPTDRFVEIEAKDLTSRFVGETGDTTGKTIERALGGVLFIDEAYALLDTSSGVEALAVLVKAMEDHKGELVVMFAGYEAQMRAFVDANPGLASRIGYQFHFEDYKPEELRDMFLRKMDAAGFVLGEGVDEQALALMRYFHNVENFGNGRFVDRVIQETIAGRANRDAEDVHEIQACDLPTTEAMCKLVASTVFDPSDVSGDEALRRVASHEIGHALVGLEETGRTDIVTITIEQEGTGALGYVQHERTGGPLPTAADLRARLAMLLAGMAAEQMVYGAYSAGNSSDLEQATNLARAYVATYGMSGAGFVQYVRPSSQKATPVADLPEDVRAQMKDLLDSAFVRAGEVLATNRAKFERMVDFILDKGTATGEQLIAVWKGEEPKADAAVDSAEEPKAAVAAKPKADAAAKPEGDAAAKPEDEPNTSSDSEEKEDAR